MCVKMLLLFLYVICVLVHVDDDDDIIHKKKTFLLSDRAQFKFQDFFKNHDPVLSPCVFL